MTSTIEPTLDWNCDSACSCVRVRAEFLREANRGFIVIPIRSFSMKRRRLLALTGGVAFPVAGCIDQPTTGTTTDEVVAEVSEKFDQPAIGIRYRVELIESVATSEQPARLRLSLENTADSRLLLGEERDVLFHHRESDNQTLYLHPATDEDWTGPVEPGCWQMTDYVAIPEYYGTISLDPNESIQADSYIYGHPDLSDSDCLPIGAHTIRTSGNIEDADSIGKDADDADFDWGFTLQLSE